MNREIVLPSGQQAVSFIPDNIERTAAIVDMETLQRIASMLKTTDLYSIKREFREKMNTCDTIEKFVGLLDDESAFHKTINLIAEYTPEPVEVKEESIYAVQA
jgi:hypothetical protein